MNKEWELQARIEGAEYFDESFDSLRDKDTFKHDMFLNSGIQWHRTRHIKIEFHTKEIVSTDYLYDLIKKDSKNIFVL